MESVFYLTAHLKILLLFNIFVVLTSNFLAVLSCFIPEIYLLILYCFCYRIIGVFMLFSWKSWQCMCFMYDNDRGCWIKICLIGNLFHGSLLYVYCMVNELGLVYKIFFLSTLQLHNKAIFRVHGHRLRNLHGKPMKFQNVNLQCSPTLQKPSTMHALLNLIMQITYTVN